MSGTDDWQKKPPEGYSETFCCCGNGFAETNIQVIDVGMRQVQARPCRKRGHDGRYATWRELPPVAPLIGKAAKKINCYNVAIRA